MTAVAAKKSRRPRPVVVARVRWLQDVVARDGRIVARKGEYHTAPLAHAKALANIGYAEIVQENLCPL